MSEELIEAAAQEAYEEALRSKGVSWIGEHSWDNQKATLHADWRRIVRLIARRLGVSLPQRSASDQQ